LTRDTEARQTLGHGGTDAELRMDPPPQDPSRRGKGENELLRLAEVSLQDAWPVRRGFSAARETRETAVTDHRDLKRLIRERKAKTGESYTAARAHVMRQRNAMMQPRATRESTRAEGAVLKVNKQSARVCLLGERGQMTLRSHDAADLIPGQIATFVFDKRWTWRGDDYASGKVERAIVDIPRLGLVPLQLEGGELEDFAKYSEPFDDPEDPYAPLWRKLTARPRPSFEFDGIAWGALPGCEPDENPTCDAAELREAGDEEGARELLMDVLCEDLRCVDAHAGLGNQEFDRWPERAMVHYQIGIAIAELSLPEAFDGLLTWGRLHNRPLLRCLHGYGLCLWRSERFAEAREVFERILSMNPNDNQGVRFCWDEVRHRKSWEEMNEHELGREQARARARARQELH
jgi:hypothetical protein